MLLGGIALSVLRLQGEPHVGRPTYGRINTLSMGRHSADYGQLLANSDPQHFEDSWMTSELWPTPTDCGSTILLQFTSETF